MSIYSVFIDSKEIITIQSMVLKKGGQQIHVLHNIMILYKMGNISINSLYI